MSVSTLKINEPQIILVNDRLHVRNADFGGTIVDLARDLSAEGNSTRLSQLLDHTIETGALVLRQGQNRALVDTVALEIDRLIEATATESGKVPEALREPLTNHLKTLADLLAEHFDPKQARSLQNQIKTLVSETTGAELRKQVWSLLSDEGAIGSQVKAFSVSNTETLSGVNTLLGKIEQKLQLDDAFERSTQKGRPFEEAVHAEIEAIHGPLGDKVACVRTDYGLLAKANKGAKSGDFVVTINPEHTHGHEVVYVIEAKTGPMSAVNAKRELETAMKNRGATAGVLIFDSTQDAPLGGRSYLPHGDGRFTAVLDPDDGGTIAFEVACLQARQAAMTSVRPSGSIDQTWLIAQCDELFELVQGASAILRGISTVERGANEIRGRYDQLRRDALAVIDEMRRRAEE